MSIFQRYFFLTLVLVVAVSDTAIGQQPMAAELLLPFDVKATAQGLEVLSYHEAEAYCRKLTEIELISGRLPRGWRYTLPTEAQWEYACRAGTTTAYSFGDDASQLFYDNTWKIGEQYAHAVEGRKPNSWGLYDMHGNGWEWCRNGYADRVTGGNDPLQTMAVDHHVLRGGFFVNGPTFARAASRDSGRSDYRAYATGFRVVCEPAFDVENSIGMKLANIPAGKFQMGTPRPDFIPKFEAYPEEEHAVEISKPFGIGAYEVTQAQYRRVMSKNGSYFQQKNARNDGFTLGDLNTDDFPADRVSWDAAVEFCEKLSSLDAERQAERRYRLTTEAEWEYACRARTNTLYNFGESLNGIDSNVDGSGGAWPYQSPSESRKTEGPNLQRPTTVGSYKPNAWGLYDMHGNIAEWCHDWYREYYSGSYVDPVGPSSSERNERVVRGGSWNNGASGACSAARTSGKPDSAVFTNGLRVVCEFE